MQSMRPFSRRYRYESYSGSFTNNDFQDYEKMCVVTKSRPSAFGKRRALDHDEEDDTFGGAIVC